MLLVLHCTRCTRSTTSLAKTVLPHASPGNGRSLTRILDARTASLRCRSASVSRRIILTIDRSASVSQIFIIIITIIVLTIIIKQVSFGLPDKKFGPAADEETRAPRKILTITESYSLPEVKYHNNQYFTILYILKYHNNQHFTILYILKYHNNQYFTILYISKYHKNQYFTLPPQGRRASKEHCRAIL